jgi:dihydroneopterin aldolase
MTCESTIELNGLNLVTQIGTYGPGEPVPNAHLLDMRIWIDSTRVFIAEDGMQHVFDYDPLIREIDRLALDGPYETQERLVTRIAEACAACPAINAVEIVLRKTPVRAGIGSLGVRLLLNGSDFERLRKTAPLPTVMV